MSIAISALKTELFSSINAPIYAVAVVQRDVNTLVDLLNRVSAVDNSTVTVGTVNALELQQCVVVGEYTQLTNQQRDLWNAIVTAATVGLAVSNTVIRQQITGIWSAGLSNTRNNLIALQTRPCSRVEALSGEGAYADATNIYVALTQ